MWVTYFIREWPGVFNSALPTRLLPPYAAPLQRNSLRFMPQIVVFPNGYREFQLVLHSMPFAI
jgi:hypothetical protein